MIRYNELLRRKLAETSMNTHSFFQMCHYYCFQKTPMLHDDVAQWKLNGVVPTYVKRFLDQC